MKKRWIDDKIHISTEIEFECLMMIILVGINCQLYSFVDARFKIDSILKNTERLIN
jgi:hypothetical protein